MILPKIIPDSTTFVEKVVRTDMFKDSREMYRLGDIESFQKTFNKSPMVLNKLEGRFIQGIVVGVKGKVLVIDLGLKMVVRYPLDELPKETLSTIKVGAPIQFQIEQLETHDGEVVLNYEKAQKEVKQKKIWNIIKKNRDHINGIVLNHVDGGYSVGLGGIVAFLPKDQVLPIKYRGKSKNHFVGSFKTFYILNVNSFRSKKNIIVSRVEAIKHSIRLHKKNERNRL